MLADAEFQGFALLAIAIGVFACIPLLERIKSDLSALREIEERRDSERIRPRLDALDQEIAAQDERMRRNHL